MSSDSFSLGVSNEEVQLHHIGLSSGDSSVSSADISGEIKNLNQSKQLKQDLTLANNATQTEELQNSVHYSQILREISLQQKDNETTEIISTNDNWMETLTKISNLVKPIFGSLFIPEDSDRQQAFVISITQQLVNKIQTNDTFPSQERERLKQKNKLLKAKLSELHEQQHELMRQIQEYKSEKRMQTNEIEAIHDKTLNENIQQIKTLVKQQQKAQKLLLRDLAFSDSSPNDSHMKKKMKHYTSKETDLTKTRRIQLPQELSTSSSSSEVYIVRTKPKKTEKVVKVHKNKHNHLETDSTYSYTFTDDKEDEKPLQRNKSKGKTYKRKINQLISLTNRIQDEYNMLEPDNDMSISTLSMIHDSLLKEEKRFK